MTVTDRFLSKSKCPDKESAEHFLKKCEWCLEKALKLFESTMRIATKLNHIAFKHGKDGDLVFDKKTHLFGRKNGHSIDFICDGMEKGKRTISADDYEQHLIVLKCTTLQSHLFYFEVGGEDRSFTVGDYKCLEKAPNDCPDEVEKYWYTENVVELSLQQLRSDVEELNENWAYEVILLTP